MVVRVFLASIDKALAGSFLGDGGVISLIFAVDPCSYSRGLTKYQSNVDSDPRGLK